MIAVIRALPAAEQRDLIALLDPARRLDSVPDDDLFPTLLVVLRRAFQAPEDADLPLYLRRRLVEVVGDSFQFIDDTSTRTDIELATALVEFALVASAEIEESEDLRRQFETFFRTKRREERDKMIDQVARLAQLMRGAKPRAVEPDDDQLKGGAAVADALLSGLSAASTRPKRTPKAASARTDSAPRLAAVMSGSAAAGLSAAAVGSTMALPLSVVAGGVYMAGLGMRKRKLQRVSSAPDEKATRERRARRSRLVQNVVTLSAFVVAYVESTKDQRILSEKTSPRR